MPAHAAQPFDATDIFGNPVKLTAISQEYPYVLLAFLRYAGCPWCNVAIHRLTLEYAELQRRGCQVVAFVQSTTERVIRDVYDKHTPRPPFPIVPDQDMTYYRQYGVQPSIFASLPMIRQLPHWLKGARDYGFTQIDGNLFLVPAWFLINTNTGTIVRSDRNADFFNHETFIKLYDALLFKD